MAPDFTFNLSFGPQGCLEAIEASALFGGVGYIKKRIPARICLFDQKVLRSAKQFFRRSSAVPDTETYDIKNYLNN